MAPLSMDTTSRCGYCMRLKVALKAAGVTYADIDIDIDIETDSAAAAFVQAVNNGNRTVPTVKFADGTTTTNPGIREVKSKLAEAAAS
jgi:mycoredoxin